MRIAVDCRFLLLGPSLLMRGIPRYVLQQLRAVLQHDHDNDYLLLHRAADDVTLLPADIRRAPNVTLHAFPGDTPAPSVLARTLAVTAVLERWLLQQRVDLFHEAAPWLPGITVLPRIDVCPVISNVYDLIPSLFQEHLTGETKDSWALAIEHVRQATRVLAISAFTARDLTLHEGVPADRIDIAYPFAESFFQPLAPDVVDARLARLRRRFGLPSRFIMTVSFPGFRSKNIETLLDGYRRLPIALRRTLPLVVVGGNDAARHLLSALCQALDITAHVIALDTVSDDEMAALYNAATMFVCPSRYEGFGLPMAEAMQCGTPVVTTTAASMPEVVGDAAWLVDAEDPRAFAIAMAALASDESRRAEMRRTGLEHVKRFTCEALGHATVGAYRRAASDAVARPSAAPAEWTVAPTAEGVPRRVAVCMRNPARVDDELRAVLEVVDALALETPVDLFIHGDGVPPFDLLRRFRMYDISALERIHAAQPYDAVLRAHAEAAVPMSWHATVYAAPPVAATATTRDATPTQPVELRIVSSDAGRARLEQETTGAMVRVVRPGVADPLGPQPLLQREQARAQLGVSTINFVVGWPDPGDDLIEAQIVLLAFADLCHVCPHASLFVGADAKTGVLPTTVASYANSLGILERIRVQAPADGDVISTTAAATADCYLVAADVVIALAAPGRVIAPHTVLRACAAGKPAIVNEREALPWLPDEACVRVPEGAAAGAVLRQALRTLSNDPLRRAAMGRAARAVYERDLTLAHMGRRFHAVLELSGAPSAADVHEADSTALAGSPAAPAVSHAASLLDLGAPADVQQDAVPARPSPTSVQVLNRTSLSGDEEGVARSAPRPRLGFNRVCNIEDFRDPELIAEMREVMAYEHRHFGDTYPAGVEHCKDWEVAMATRTLRHFGALRPDTSILGVAAGMEDTIFYLTRHVGEVMAVDRYAQAGVWQLNSPLWMLVMPELGAPDGCAPERLVVQHMDARRLRFPDDRFDGIFSSGSIEHFGGLMDVAHSAYEMGRVLKPGGILSLSTVMAIAGPRDRMGTPGTCLLFQPEHIVRYIVEASGLELVDPFVTEATPATLAIHRPLEAMLTSVATGAAAHGLKGLQEEYKHGALPCVVLDWDGITFDSVHLALRKPLTRPRVTNAWARPTPATEAAIADDYRRLVEDYDAWTPAISVPAAAAGCAGSATTAVQARSASRLVRNQATNLASDLDGLRSEVNRHATRPDVLQASVPISVHTTTPTSDPTERTASPAPSETTPAMPGPAAPAPGAVLPDTWVQVPVALPSVPPFVIFIDRSDRRDIVANAYLQGPAHNVAIAEFSLIRAFVQPGDAVIDAGAHLGSITLPLAAVGCRVLAVEASSRNATLLRASVAYNGFREVTVVHAAAAAAEGSLGFLADGAWGWVVPPGETASEYVPAVRLDDLVDGLGWDRVAAIKIDVEGSELAAIAGLSRLLSRADAPMVYYESNTHTLAHAGIQAGQVVAALAAHGYRSYAVSPGRLTRVHPDDVQTVVVRDHVAVKGALPSLSTFIVNDGPGRR